MSFKVVSGTGNGRELHIDDTNRARVRSITEEDQAHASGLGYRYNLNTGTVNLTSASASAVMYLANNEDSDLIISTLGFLLGTSTGGSGDATIDVYVKPTGGTIISGASAGDINENLNLGSPNTLDVNFYKGAEGNTITGGSKLTSTITSTPSRVFIALGKLIIPKGQSIGVTVTPQGSNTSMNVQIVATGWVATSSVVGGSVS